MSFILSKFVKVLESESIGRSRGLTTNKELVARNGGFVAAIFSIVSFVLTILNVSKGYTFMMWTTIILTVGFALAAVLYFSMKDSKLAVIICAIMICIIFSVYAYTGENEGFAILWIMLVPLISLSWFGLDIGVATCLYFVVFLAVLFYTPLRAHVDALYTDTFKIRFPIIYLADTIVSIVLAAQKDYFLHKTEIQAYTDSLTGLGNRSMYNIEFDEMSKKALPANTVVISIDVNRLKFVNDNMGHDAGDEIIKATAALMEKAFSEKSLLCRIGGDEFVVLDYEEGVEITRGRIKDFQRLVSEWKGEIVDSLSVSTGYAAKSDFPGEELGELCKLADRMMYENKSEFYRTSGFDRRTGTDRRTGVERRRLQD